MISMEAIGKKLKGISGFKENEGINETFTSKQIEKIL